MENKKRSIQRCRQNIMMLSKGFMTLRLLSTSRSLCIREIIKNEDGKTITFEGLRKASPRTKKLIDPNILNKACCHESTECHPLCRFEKVHEIKHTGIKNLKRQEISVYSFFIFQTCSSWISLWMEKAKSSIEI